MLENLKTNEFAYQRLTEEEQNKRGILGRLKGIIADTKNPTRNGRKYSEQLWEHVFEDPIMKEKIANRCCFGELGHPADRTETDMEKIAICLAEVPKKGKDGNLYGVFDILNTPNGRILKSLCDYGCNIGVSSRGQGDLFTDDDGNESVDPDTYDCECWDAVLIPAVESARMQYVTEALDKTRYKKSLRESLRESLDKATEDERKVMKESLNDLGIELDEKLHTTYIVHSDVDENNDGNREFNTPEEAIKYAKDCGDCWVDKVYIDPNDETYEESETIWSYDLDEENKEEVIESKSCKEEIEDEKESEVLNKEDDSKVVEDLQEALKENALLKKQIHLLQDKVTVGNSKVKSLSEELVKYKNLTVKLSDKALVGKELTEKVSTLEEELKNKEIKIKKLIEDKKQSLSHSKTLNESITQKNSDYKTLQEKFDVMRKSSATQINKLEEEIEDLKADTEVKLTESRNKIAKANKLVEQYKQFAQDTVDRYIATKAKMLGVSVNRIKNELSESYSIDDIDAVCEDLLESNLNFSKLSFGNSTLSKTSKMTVTESVNDNLARFTSSDDNVDDQLLRLAGRK